MCSPQSQSEPDSSCSQEVFWDNRRYSRKWIHRKILEVSLIWLLLIARHKLWECTLELESWGDYKLCILFSQAFCVNVHKSDRMTFEHAYAWTWMPKRVNKRSLVAFTPRTGIECTVGRTVRISHSHRKFDKHEFMWSARDLRSNAFDARMYLVFTLLFKTTGTRRTPKIMNLSSRPCVCVCVFVSGFVFHYTYSCCCCFLYFTVFHFSFLLIWFRCR